ncbi:hypothetical protein AAEH98_12950 [Shewanella xiamenensis]
MDENEIVVASKSVVGLNDWHLFYSKIKEETNIKNITEKVIDLLSEKSEYWDQYTADISKWIRDRLPQ